MRSVLTESHASEASVGASQDVNVATDENKVSPDGVPRERSERGASQDMNVATEGSEVNVLTEI